MKYQLMHGKVFQEKGDFVSATVYVCGDRIVTREGYESTPGPEKVVDLAGQTLIPGLTDIHFHGCVGHDCCDASLEALAAICRHQLREGVLQVTPSTMTVGEEQLLSIAQTAGAFAAWQKQEWKADNTASAPSNEGISTASTLSEVETAASETSIAQMADFCGLYMEGPFINIAKKGAQNGAHVRQADTALVDRLQEASGGLFRSVVIAPETEGALAFIRENHDRFNLSLGHTNTDYETARQALSLGARQLTHTFNAMPPLSHRAPGPIAAAAEDANCRAELICDGVHIHPSMVRLAFSLFGDERIIMISDSLRAAGLSDGSYELGGQTFHVNGPLATLDDGTIAGSVSSLMGCVRTVVQKMDIPLHSAIRCAALNPARAVGIDEDYGSVVPGKIANLVVLDENLAITKLIHRGRMV